MSGSSLDHEEVEHYIIIASCSDGGSPALTATATVYINVLDVNDNEPQVEKAVYEVRVSENIKVGEEIVKIQASDPDEGILMHL